HRYADSIAPMLVLLPGIVMMSLYLILTRLYTSRHRQEINIFAATVALAINISLNLFLIPRFGIVGAASASGVSYSVAATILLLVFRRESGTPVGRTVLVQRSEIRDLARFLTRGRRASVG